MKFKVSKISSIIERSPLLRLALAAVVVLVFTFFLRAINSGAGAAPDFSAGNPGPEVLVEVLPGETGTEIGRKLVDLGVVESSLAFFRAAVADPRASRIAPGEHRVETRIPARTALEQLLDAKRIPNLIIVRDGARLTEIKESILAFGMTRQNLDEALKNTKPPTPFQGENLEGFFYPAQYSFNKDVTAKKIVRDMIVKFTSTTDGVNWTSIPGFSANEILTIASLVESEGTPDVFGNVARVIFNRLKVGMPLQFDSTVHYALNRRGEIRISISETKVDSKYNTFINRGLPPGPIGSPTRLAIEATLNPPAGDWLYFVTVRPGETRFTSSYEVFLGWKAEYKKNFKAGLFE